MDEGRERMEENANFVSPGISLFQTRPNAVLRAASAYFSQFDIREMYSGQLEN